MKAYKFRSAAQLEFALDIIQKGRLYCSEWHTLNDPMEGFHYQTRHLQAIIVGEEMQQLSLENDRNFRMELANLRVCSLSRTYTNPLLWAHYAGGFNGIAIEVDLPDNDPNIVHINYEKHADIHADGRMTPFEMAKEALRTKPKDWIYEEEVRIISYETHFPLQQKISRIITGTRLSKPISNMLKQYCPRLGIEIQELRINWESEKLKFE